MKIIIGLAFVVLVMPLDTIYAEDPIVFDLTVSDSTNITEYINRFYMSAVAIAGITAMIMIVIGAIYYVVSGGSQDKQREGKDIITSAIWGVVLLLGAYTILNTVNPELVTLSPPGGEKITIYSCGQENPVKNECEEEQSPVPPDADAAPLCCVPGLGDDLLTEESIISDCPQLEDCGDFQVDSETKEIRTTISCAVADEWRCGGRAITIEEGGKYLTWAYYPKNTDAGVAADLREVNGFHVPETGSKGAACIVYAYKKKADDMWTNVTVTTRVLNLCLGFTR